MIKCQIIRSKQGDIIAVEAPNGEASILYNNLSSITDEQSALDLWSYSYTDTFEKLEEATNKDQNGEHFIDTVTKRLKLDTTDSKVSSEDLSEITTSFNNFHTASFNNLYTALDSAFFKNGLFVVDTKELVNSGLFNKSEANYIKNSQSTQQSIKTMIHQLKNSLDSIDDTLYIQNSNLSFTNGEFTKFGKLKVENIEETVLNKLVGITDRSEFDSEALSIPNQGFISRYMSDAVFADSLYNDLSTKTKLDVLDTNLQPVYLNDTSVRMLNTLKTGVENFHIAKITDTLSKLDSDIWYDSIPEVSKLLKELEKNATNIGLDLFGLKDSAEYKTNEEVAKFTNEVADITTKLFLKTASKQDIVNFSEVYDQYFGVSKTVKNAIFDKTDYTLQAIETTKSEAELFNSDGYVHVEGNIYHKVDKSEINLDSFYEVVFEDTAKLPREAYYPSAFNTNNEFVKNRLQDNKYQDSVKKDILKFIDSKVAENFGQESGIPLETLRQLVMAKYSFGHNVSSKRESLLQNESELKNNLKDFNGNTTYLTGEFLSDLNVYIAKEKYKNSSLYNNALKYLDIGDNGVYLTSSSEYAKNSLRALVRPENKVHKDLIQYTKISKDTSLNTIFSGVSTELPINNNILRDLYVNNPFILKPYKGKFNQDLDGMVTVSNVTDNFLNISGVIYEKTGSFQNLSTYSLLGSQQSELFNSKNKYGINKTTTTDAHLFNTNKSNKTGVKLENMMNKEELDTLESTMDRCS